MAEKAVTETMTEKEMDSDYSLSRVPAEAKQKLWRIVFVRIGYICCVGELMLGASLGFGMSFGNAMLVTLLGSVFLQVISWGLGTAAAREGLSCSMLSRWAGLGKKGSAVFGAVVAISMIGWFGVQNSVFGQGLADIIPLTDFLGGAEFGVWATITGLAITLVVVLGIGAIANLAVVLVPLFMAAAIFSAAIALQDHSLMELLVANPAGTALSIGAGTTIVAGGFIAGSICTPDYARFLNNGKEVFWMTLIGTFVGEFGTNIIGVLLALAMGTSDIITIMMGTSGILGVLIVVASTAKVNDLNLYTSGLGISTFVNSIFNKKVNRTVLIWTLGIIGTFLSVIGIINYFTDFLTLLGVALPPVAGIIVIDYFILKRGRAALDESRERGALPSKVENWNPVAMVCWVAAFAIGEVTSIYAIGIACLNSLIGAGLLYFVAMKVVAALKHEDEAVFEETDLVL